MFVTKILKLVQLNYILERSLKGTYIGFSWLNKHTKQYFSRVPMQIFYGTKMSFKLFTQYADMVRDIFLVVTVGQLVSGGGFFLQWVNFFSV